MSQDINAQAEVAETSTQETKTLECYPERVNCRLFRPIAARSRRNNLEERTTRGHRKTLLTAKREEG